MSTLVYKLVLLGRKIFLLERGGYLPREKEEGGSRTAIIDSKYRADES